MTKPIIGISGSIMYDEHGPFVNLPHAYVNQDYPRSVSAAGGLPFMIPFTKDDDLVRETVSHIDALLLSGGHDIYPLFYDQEPLQGIGNVWPERDHFDFTLLEEAEKRGIPILGICRGHQVINVYHGGTLFQDLKYDKNCTVKHWQNQTPELATHTIEIEEDSILANILERTEWVTNSHHHQTVDRVGEGLRVIATTKDGTIEALQGTEYPWLVSCQFHPEMMSINNKLAQKIFNDFITVTINNKTK